MYTIKSSSENFVQDVSEMLTAGKNPKVFFALFDTDRQLAVLKEAMTVLGLKITGYVSDAQLTAHRKDPFRTNSGKVEKNSKLTGYSLEQLRGMDDVVIVFQIHDSHRAKVESYLESQKMNCRIFHYSEIQSSAIVNGTFRVINKLDYLAHWPWIMDILLKDMPLEDRTDFSYNKVISTVVSNGRYYAYTDKETKWAKLEGGYRATSTTPYQDKGGRKYTVTTIGDSRFFNSMLPTDLTLIAALQREFDQANMNCEARNFSVTANFLQNEYAMLKSMTLTKDDIIFATIGKLGRYPEYSENTMTGEERCRLKVRIMLEMQQYCQERGATIFFVYLPNVQEIPNLTNLEQFIMDSYGLCYDPDTEHDMIEHLCVVTGVNYIDVTSKLIHTDRTALFLDSNHFGPEGCSILAKIFRNYVSAYISKQELLFSPEMDEKKDRIIQAHKNFVINSLFKGMAEYIATLQKLSEGKPENCGAIVMNCNPFTLGHRYLIETAAKQVEHLYVMAVEEDRSVFKFEDRIEMIRRGTADLPNVEVIPSSKFIASSITFPEYFERSERPDAKIDTSADAEIFCTYIAPNLKVKTRFVGEEPIDMVTNQYNTCLKEILPQHGLSLVEIPRKESGGMVISASRVRKYLKEKQYEEVKKIVPKTTYDYLIDVLGY